MQFTAMRRLTAATDRRVEEHAKLAAELADAGRYVEAERQRAAVRRLVRQNLEVSPPDPLLLNDYGVALAEVGELDRAIDCLERAHAVTPRDPTVLFNLATALWRRGHCSDARRAAARARLLAPDDTEIRSLVNRIQGTLSVYEPDFRFSTDAVPVTAARRLDLRSAEISPLHVLRASLPHVSAGYTFRSQELLEGQEAIGLRPLAVTAPLFPEDCFIDGGQPLDVEDVEGVRYHRLRIPGGFVADPSANSHFKAEFYREEIRQPLAEYLSQYADELSRLCDRLGPHILHSHSDPKNGLAAGAVASARGIPHVYEVRYFREDASVARGKLPRHADRYRLERELESRCCREADAVVTLSQIMRDELVSRGVQADKIFLVPNGANVERFPFTKQRCRGLEKRLGLGSGPVVGYIGSLSTYEGVSDLLTSFRLIVDAIPTARLLIVGGERDAEEAYLTASDLGLGDSVVFAGVVDRSEILDYYSVIDVFVVPRPPVRVCKMVTPLKLYEAMATGRAVVVSDVPALQEMITEGETAVSFEAGRPDSLAAVCLDLLGDPEGRSELGAKAASWVRQHRDWTTVARGYLDAYEYAFQARERRAVRASESTTVTLAAGQRG
jgi:glycosyltransferase involved in cell wall biosynthesis